MSVFERPEVDRGRVGIGTGRVAHVGDSVERAFGLLVPDNEMLLSGVVAYPERVLKL